MWNIHTYKSIVKDYVKDVEELDFLVKEISVYILLQRKALSRVG